MHTTVIKITNTSRTESAISEAAELLRAGEVVAFPTETVYGLGANAKDATAVAKIFTAKERPADNPLIVHIANLSQLTEIVRDVPHTAKLLIEAFWPGPLSLVLPKHSSVPDIVTAGLDTVVVRFPSHPIAQDLIAATDSPIAAPSANRSGNPSGTTATHVLADFDGKIPLIIDAGPVLHGLESTVVDCTEAVPVLLRPGAIPIENLREIVPEITTSQKGSPARSPGMKYRHYSPHAKLLLFTGNNTATEAAIRRHFEAYSTQKFSVLWHTGNFTGLPSQIRLSSAVEEAAPRLFAALRELDERQPEAILVQGYPRTGLGAAIMNRLEKAASTQFTC